MAQEGAMAFIDWENLRQSISRNFAQRITPRPIIDAIRQVVEELGCAFRGGSFYGDWSRRAIDAREIHNHGLSPIHVVPTRRGKDRSDPRMMLDMYDMIKERSDIGVFILGSGDSGFADVIRRGKEHGKRMYVCAVGLSTARELFTLSDGVFPLEVRLGLTLKAAQLPLTPPEVEWRIFVLRLNSLESKLPYVVRNYLRDRILEPSMGCGETLEEKETFLNRAVEDGIVIEYEIENPKLPGRTVVACRLNKENDLVKRILMQK